MHEVWTMAGLWLGLALLAALISAWFRIANALTEIVVGTVAGFVALTVFNTNIGADIGWIKFLAGAGAIILTFLAGAEIDPVVFKAKWKEATAIGFISFLSPFLGCAWAAYYFLNWTTDASWLAGVALSTTSVAVVYAVMLELGLNKTEFGKTVLAACFITDLGTVVALGLIFAPFTYKTALFVGVSLFAFLLLPRFTSYFIKKYGNRPSEIEAKYLLMVLFVLGALAVWADSEAVLPAYVFGMVLAGSVGRDHTLIRRLRTLTFGLLTPFYFIRAGSYVSVQAIFAAPFALFVLFISKMITKILGVYPTTKFYKYAQKEGIYTTLLMSTGLTFGSISALFGFTKGIIDQQQYSLLIVAVIASAVVPTMIANAFFIPKYLLPKKEGKEDD
ncbi:MAG: cation:proton antiporter [Thermodesulfovibrionales bacterium]|nr:cation:proton antiporter [Thermodesulfovibrionales bacterium]